jgi:UDP-GlcNAc:undecaprenyl-phosphate GlcNAc-1-phosphate transferase
MIFVYIFFIFLNFILFCKIEFFSKKINIYDNPNNIRKIHKFKIPRIGGIFLMINVLLIFFIDNFITEILIFEPNNKMKILILITLFFIFLIGFYDDKNDLKASIKFLLFFFIYIPIINLDKTLHINYLEFSFLNKIYISQISIFFSILCFILFLNFSNMYDGINGLSVFFFSICLIFLAIKTGQITFFILLLIFSFYFLINNIKNKLFLGDLGVYIYSFIISYSLIKTYNIKKNIFCDEILVLILFPALDMLRVIFTRILIGKNPFTADNLHLHHLIFKVNQSHNKTLIILALSKLISMFILIIFGAITGLIFSIIVYTLLLFLSFKKYKILKL